MQSRQHYNLKFIFTNDVICPPKFKAHQIKVVRFSVVNIRLLTSQFIEQLGKMLTSICGSAFLMFVLEQNVLSYLAMENLYCNLALIFSIFLITKLVLNYKQNLPPSPFALPIIGHLYLIKKPLHLALEDLLSQYGPIIYLRFGCKSILVVSSPSAVEECFTKNDKILADRPRFMAADHFTYNYNVYAMASYGHLWRSLRRFTVVEIFSTTSLQKSFTTLQHEVHNLLRLVFMHSIGGDQKVELKTLFLLLNINFMMRIVAGKPGIEVKGAEMEVLENFLLDFKERFFPSLSMNICDFFPFLRSIGYKGMEKSFVRIQKKRDEYLQNLIDEIRLKKAVTSSTMRDGENNRTLIETLLSLQESDPEFYSDQVIKSNVVVSTDTLIFLFPCILPLRAYSFLIMKFLPVL